MRRWLQFAAATILGGALGVLMMGPAPAQQPVPAPEPTGDTGYFNQAGGAVKKKLAKTQTAATNFGETASWVSLPLANLSFAVPANTTDLFNVSFTSEGRLFGGGNGDYVRIRILDTVTGIPLEPYDGGQAFFSANNYATYTGTWAKRMGAGVHSIQVQFWMTPCAGCTFSIDDWTFELVVFE
jgi:hypothetical protein